MELLWSKRRLFFLYFFLHFLLHKIFIQSYTKNKFCKRLTARQNNVSGLNGKNYNLWLDGGVMVMVTGGGGGGGQWKKNRLCFWSLITRVMNNSTKSKNETKKREQLKQILEHKTCTLGSFNVNATQISRATLV